MLLQFTFSNFRAFREIQTLNLAASNYDKTLAGNCIKQDIPGLRSRSWLKGVGLYGPNASGKSSVIEALQSMAELVIHSAKVTDPEEPIAEIQPFALDPKCTKEPTAFSVAFVSDDKRYEYRVAATKEKIHHESLRSFDGTKERLWFSRDWNAEGDEYDWISGNSNIYARDPKKEEYTLRNVLYLSKAISLGDKQLEPVFRWFKSRLKFVDLSTRSPNFDHGYTARQFEDVTELAPRILELLRQADLGIDNVRVANEKMPESVATILERLKDVMPQEIQAGIDEKIKIGETQKVELTHARRGGESVPLPWNMESAGTHRLFALAGPWLNILDNGYTVCIDELETSMHPLMVTALLKLLFCDKTNTKGAQVIFTTHNPLLLDSTLIRRDQVWFADKDDYGLSHLYPLTDYTPRKGESLIRGYLAGRYGAVPFIPEGLLGSFTSASETEEDSNYGK